MRLGLFGLVEPDVAGQPWRSLAASLGAEAEVIVVGGATVGRTRARWDAVIVCGALAIEESAGASGERAALDQALVAFARGGGPVLGIGGGFRSLCALGLLPGRVTASADDDDPAPPGAHLRVEGRATPFTSAIPAGRVMSLSGASAVRLRYDVAEPEALESRGQVIFRYCDAAGGSEAHPAHAHSIAGVCGQDGNVVGVLADAQAFGAGRAQLVGSLRMHLAGKR